MATPTWMHSNSPTVRQRVRRTRGRRGADRRPSLESILIATVLLAWGWGMYEVTLIFLR